MSRAQDALDASMSQYEAISAVVLLISMIALLALCAPGPRGGAVGQGNPSPVWIQSISPDPALDTGILGCSDGMNIINQNCVHRHRKGTFETDGARWGAPLSKGKHVFEIYWPTVGRGTHATAGVGTESAPMFVKPKDSLVGSNPKSWGLDIVRKKAVHNSQALTTCPRAGLVPDKFYMYVDCDSGTVGFGTDFAYYGAPLRFPLDKLPVYAMVGCCQPNAQITMIYRGSENRAAMPSQINKAVVPSIGPGGAVNVVVVNTNQTAYAGYPPPGAVAPGPAYGTKGEPVPPPAYNA